ncbi:hypothetical protein JZ751_004430 [Albula glossodonta]|uniref:Uncharacterized protein n=1 Tax=Albula glossodonta TaxID=121402 RepID=A0A8T2NCZ5_9TELE|nr:hypothetical protein JZ751_004430 [Albula glossodonta]
MDWRQTIWQFGETTEMGLLSCRTFHSSIQPSVINHLHSTTTVIWSLPNQSGAAPFVDTPSYSTKSPPFPAHLSS